MAKNLPSKNGKKVVNYAEDKELDEIEGNVGVGLDFAL